MKLTTLFVIYENSKSEPQSESSASKSGSSKALEVSSTSSSASEGVPVVIVLDVSVQATGDDTQLFHFVDPELAKGGGTVLEIFEGHLQ